MVRDFLGRRAALAVLAFLVAYAAAIALITAANNGWYPVRSAEFCGSLGDFHDSPVPTVCLGVADYYARAAVHPPYVLLGTVVAAAVAIGASRRTAPRKPWD